MSPNVSDSRENRMDTHKNASLTPKGREAMTRSVVEGGLSKAVAARQFNTTPKTVAKWVDRFQVALRILAMSLDTGTSTGRLMLNVFASVAQFEPQVMLDRHREGL